MVAGLSQGTSCTFLPMNPNKSSFAIEVVLQQETCLCFAIYSGYPGADLFPTFVRRLSTFGHGCAAFLFTKGQFSDGASTDEIAVMMAQLEPFIAFPNDLLSFYKESKNSHVSPPTF